MIVQFLLYNPCLKVDSSEITHKYELMTVVFNTDLSNVILKYRLQVWSILVKLQKTIKYVKVTIKCMT